MRPFSFSVGILLLTTATFFCDAQTSYKVTDLGALNNSGYSTAQGINAVGAVTGAVGKNNSNSSEAFLYSNGAMKKLGTLGGNSAIGIGINASGQVVGYSQNSAGVYRAFLASNGTMSDIGDLGGGSAVGYGINDAGEVVGSAVTAEGENHPFLYTGGKMIDLGTLGSSDNNWWHVAQGINKSGIVVGTSYNAQGNFFGFVWSQGENDEDGYLGWFLERRYRHQ